MSLEFPKHIGLIENDENPCGFEYSEYSSLCNGREPHICGDNIRDACKVRGLRRTPKVKK